MCVCTLYWFERIVQQKMMITKRDNNDKEQFIVDGERRILCEFFFSFFEGKSMNKGLLYSLDGLDRERNLSF